MKVSLWAAKNLLWLGKSWKDGSGFGKDIPSQPTPSEIIAGAITGEYDLTTIDFIALRDTLYLKELDQRLIKLGNSQKIQYDTSINALNEIDDSRNAAAKFVIAFFALLESELITNDKLDLFAETFLYMEKNKLPIDKYTADFIALAEDGATYEELSLFAHSAVSLIRADESPTELTENMLFTMNIPNTTENERRDLVASYCNQATQDLTRKYETTVNKIARYITYTQKTATGIATKAALILFG